MNGLRSQKKEAPAITGAPKDPGHILVTECDLQTASLPQLIEITGGADRDRTDDLLNAIQALSQLSYSPFFPGIITTLPVDVNNILTIQTA